MFLYFSISFLLGAVFSTEEAGPWCEVPELSALKFENWPVFPENFSYNTDVTDFWSANGWSVGSVPRDNPNDVQMDYVEFRVLTLDGINDYTFSGGFEDQRGQELAVLTRTVDTTGRYKLRIRNYGFFVHVKITPPGFGGSEQEYVVENTEETIYFDAVAGDTLTITEEVGLIVVRDFQLLCSHIPQGHDNFCEVPELGALIQDHWPVYPDDDTNNADVVGFWEENGWTVHSVPRNSPNDAELQHVRFQDANDNGVLLDRVFGGGFMERGQEILHLTRMLSTTGKYKLRLMNYGFFVYIKITDGTGSEQEFTCGKNTEETFFFEANAGDTLEITESIGLIAVREFSVLCSDDPTLELCEDAELTTLIPSHWPELPSQEGPNQNIVDFWWANTWAAATSLGNGLVGAGTRQEFYFKKFEDASGQTHWAIDGDFSDRGDENWLFWKALPETGTYKFFAMNYGFNIWINVVGGGNIQKFHIGKNRPRTIYFQANAGDMIGIMEIDGLTNGEGLMEVLEFKSPCVAGECPSGEEMIDGACEEMKCRLLDLQVCAARDDCVVKRANGSNPRCKKNKCRLYATQEECLDRGCIPIISRRGRFRRCS